MRLRANPHQIVPKRYPVTFCILLIKQILWYTFGRNWNRKKSKRIVIINFISSSLISFGTTNQKTTCKLIPNAKKNDKKNWNVYFVLTKKFKLTVKLLVGPEEWRKRQTRNPWGTGHSGTRWHGCPTRASRIQRRATHVTRRLPGTAATSGRGARRPRTCGGPSPPQPRRRPCTGTASRRRRWIRSRRREDQWRRPCRVPVRTPGSTSAPACSAGPALATAVHSLRRWTFAPESGNRGGSGLEVRRSRRRPATPAGELRRNWWSGIPERRPEYKRSIRRSWCSRQRRLGIRRYCLRHCRVSLIFAQITLLTTCNITTLTNYIKKCQTINVF